MKQWIKGFLLVFLTQLTTAQAEIIKIDSVDGLVSYLDNVRDASTEVYFDVDMVLVMPQESYFRMPTLKKYRALYKSMTRSLTGAQKDMMLMYMLIDSPLVPLDDKMVSLIHSLQNRGIPTIAFTAMLTGSIERMANMAAWRNFSLEYAGYHFANGFPYLAQSVVFDKLPKYIGSYPLYSQGVLFANEGHHGPVKKGKVLVEFLNYVFNVSKGGYSMPRRIIMVDDRQKHLVEIENSLRAAFPQVSFTGIYFTAAEHVPVTQISESEFKNKLQQIIAEVRANPVPRN